MNWLQIAQVCARRSECGRDGETACSGGCNWHLKVIKVQSDLADLKVTVSDQGEQLDGRRSIKAVFDWKGPIKGSLSETSCSPDIVRERRIYNATRWMLSSDDRSFPSCDLSMMG